MHRPPPPNLSQPCSCKHKKMQKKWKDHGKLCQYKVDKDQDSKSFCDGEPQPMGALCHHRRRTDWHSD